MGGGGSKTKVRSQPVIKRDPKPDTTSAVDGINVGMAQGCKKCTFTVDKGISASSVKMYREFGTITKQECDKFQVDVARVRGNEFALAEFIQVLKDGKYYNNLGNGYCTQLIGSSDELDNVTSMEGINWETMVTKPKVRKVSEEGSFSQVTKVMIVPSIPFKIGWNGQSISVSKMTLFHPSPIRIDNKQHDAVLTLNDPADGASEIIVMIPLVGSITPGQSGSFIGKIASYLPGVLSPNPATGQYESIEVPTGTDWDLTKVIPGSPQDGKVLVDVPYYSWEPTKRMEEYLAVNTNSLRHYKWRSAGNAKPRYIMLAEPVPVSSFDMMTINMLPVTPAKDAVHAPVALSLVYSAPSSASSQYCKNKKAKAAATTTKKEKFTNTEEGEENCDPFANMPQSEGISFETIISIILGIISGLAALIGLYYALKYVTTSKVDIFKTIGNKFGSLVAGGPKTPEAAEAAKVKAEEAKATSEAREKALIEKERERQLASLTKQEERKKVLAESKATLGVTDKECENMGLTKTEERIKRDKFNEVVERTKREEAEEAAQAIKAAKIAKEEATKKAKAAKLEAVEAAKKTRRQLKLDEDRKRTQRIITETKAKKDQQALNLEDIEIKPGTSSRIKAEERKKKIAEEALKKKIAEDDAEDEKKKKEKDEERKKTAEIPPHKRGLSSTVQGLYGTIKRDATGKKRKIKTEAEEEAEAKKRDEEEGKKKTQAIDARKQSKVSAITPPPNIPDTSDTRKQADAAHEENKKLRDKLQEAQGLKPKPNPIAEVKAQNRLARAAFDAKIKLTPPQFSVLKAKNTGGKRKYKRKQTFRHY